MVDIGTILNITSFSIASFLGMHFFFLKTATNRFLGLFLIFTAVSVLASETSNPLLTGLSSPFLLAPFLLGFVLDITNNLHRSRKNLGWLFIPAILDSLLNLLLPHYITGIRISILISSVFNLIIFFWVLIELKRHSQKILNTFSAVEGKRLIWLRNLILINILFSILWLVDDSLYFFLGANDLSMVISEISLFSTLLTILWIGFAGLRQFPIYQTPSIEVEESMDGDVETVVLPDLENKYSALLKLIETKKLFLNKNLSLQDLAEEVQIRNKDLSQIINQGYGQNFYHFINHFRIQYFKYLVQAGEDQKMSLEGLAKEVGFNSKSTFYAAFKKEEGMTPRAYTLLQK